MSMSRTSNQVIQRAEWNWPTFVALTIVQLWAAHAFVFFAHEYAHSFVAWLLGWKANPLALNYAHPTLTVFLIQLGIDQNVNEVPIFASGHGLQAAIISLSGAFLGNALFTYSLSRWGYAAAKRHASRGWELLILFGIPTLLVLLYFFLRIEPATLRWLFPHSAAKRVAIALLTAFILFDFYGAAGWADGGRIAHKMSVISVCIVAPLIAALTATFAARRPATDTP
jgi:hypothetical protein